MIVGQVATNVYRFSSANELSVATECRESSVSTERSFRHG